MKITLAILIAALVSGCYGGYGYNGYGYAQPYYSGGYGYNGYRYVSLLLRGIRLQRLRLRSALLLRGAESEPVTATSCHRKLRRLRRLQIRRRLRLPQALLLPTSLCPALLSALLPKSVVGSVAIADSFGSRAARSARRASASLVSATGGSPARAGLGSLLT